MKHHQLSIIAVIVLILLVVTGLVDEVKAEPAEVKPDRFDLGAGFIVGIPSGIKARIRYTADFGLSVGMDLDAGIAFIVNDATASGVMGWSFRKGKHMITPYVLFGGGNSVIFAVFTASKGSITHSGIGIEWKPRRWIGFGIEAGANTMSEGNAKLADEEAKIDEAITYPFARLSLIFYF